MVFLSHLHALNENDPDGFCLVNLGSFRLQTSPKYELQSAAVVLVDRFFCRSEFALTHLPRTRFAISHSAIY